MPELRPRRQRRHVRLPVPVRCPNGMVVTGFIRCDPAIEPAQLQCLVRVLEAAVAYAMEQGSQGRTLQ